jgi:hypothetical protein
VIPTAADPGTRIVSAPAEDDRTIVVARAPARGVTTTR